VSLLDRLQHPDDEVRLAAVRLAATSGELGLVDTLLDLALHDSAEVRTAGGLAEVYEHVGDAAAEALGGILGRRDGDDPRIRAVAVDLDQDDERVATLLYYLGRRYEPLRRELETHPEGRVRLRAVKAVLATERTREFAARFLADSSPLVRAEALRVPANQQGHDACRRLLAEDPDPRVRTAAAGALRFTSVGSGPFIAAARVETDPGVRRMLLACLARRYHDRANALAVAGFLTDPRWFVRREAAAALRDVADPAVVAAVALRVLVEPDDRVLYQLVPHKHLLALAPELRGPLERLHRDAKTDGERWVLSTALAAPTVAARAPSSVEDLVRLFTDRMVAAGADPPPPAPPRAGGR
jgi:HEAT repeat protein